MPVHDMAGGARSTQLNYSLKNKTIMSRDYIPNKTAQFMTFQQNLNTQVTANAVAWNVPATEATSLDTWSTGYATVFNPIINKNTRTRQQVIAHDQYKADYIAFLRPFCQAFLTNNLLIPMSERVAMGLNPRGLNPPSTRPKIITAPIPSLKPLGGGMVQFGFKVADSVSLRGRHPDSNGVEVYFKLEPVSAGQAVLNDSLVAEDVEVTDATVDGYDNTFNTRASFISELGLDKVGMRLTIYARWVNTSDPTKNGPYSGAISMVVS